MGGRDASASGEGGGEWRKYLKTMAVLAQKASLQRVLVVVYRY